MNVLGFPDPSTAVDGTETYARFRIPSLEVAPDPRNRWYLQPYEPGSPLPDGELEDYAVTVEAVSVPSVHPEIPDTAISTAETYETCTSTSAVSGFHVPSPGSASIGRARGSGSETESPSMQAVSSPRSW